MHPRLTHHLSALVPLCRAYHVERLSLFGSSAREHDFDATKSDADFLVAFNASSPLSPSMQFFGFLDALETLMGRPIDLVEEGAIKNPYLHATIEADRVVVYSEDLAQ